MAGRPWALVDRARMVRVGAWVSMAGRPWALVDRARMVRVALAGGLPASPAWGLGGRFQTAPTDSAIKIGRA